MSLTPAQIARKRARKNLNRKNKQYNPQRAQELYLRKLKEQAEKETLVL